MDTSVRQASRRPRPRRVARLAFAGLALALASGCTKTELPPLPSASELGARNPTALVLSRNLDQQLRDSPDPQRAKARIVAAVRARYPALRPASDLEAVRRSGANAAVLVDVAIARGRSFASQTTAEVSVAFLDEAMRPGALVTGKGRALVKTQSGPDLSGDEALDGALRDLTAKLYEARSD
jgi:hypothetical protein